MYYNTEGKNILEKMNKSPMKYINTVSLRYRYDLISKKKKNYNRNAKPPFSFLADTFDNNSKEKKKQIKCSNLLKKTEHDYSIE